ncbi:AN1-type zinc finger domain-containing protein [Salinibaculum rarum]|uniref:AN1-type zinc finger domain-containing protein n=1 Tax=Salinibaculum rarum TaxID=3058903 RepID=UPI00265FD835|nr:AN1-type zinc finger protein [Salinibaculum sp. KK48]
MATCAHCGTEVDHPFTCTHCNSQFCGDHRLPEKHDCPLHVPESGQGGKSTAHISGQHTDRNNDVEAPEPMEMDDRSTPGSTVREPPSDTSPAVETKDGPQDPAPQSSSSSRVRRWKLSSEVLGIRLRSATRTAIRLAGIGLVVLAAYNALLTPLYDTPVVGFYRVAETAVLTETFAYVYVEDVAAAMVGAAVAWFV